MYATNFVKHYETIPGIVSWRTATVLGVFVRLGPDFRVPDTAGRTNYN